MGAPLLAQARWTAWTLPSAAYLYYVLACLPESVRVALHVCGRGVQDLCSGESGVSALVNRLRRRGGRVQINVDLARAPEILAPVETWVRQNRAAGGPATITQHNAANADLSARLACVPGHGFLFDASGGRGLAADDWPQPLGDSPCGYAGGLGPDSIAQQLPRIVRAACGAPFWIDMESRLRDDVDNFRLAWAETVLQQVLPFVAANRPRGWCMSAASVSAAVLR
ncbi:hypothetical protein B1A_16640 [mine drainage metagenome]|uniref:Uncharacterized protein n=1 Tax=mine drainage metagenome TaxID=410659 RepID=T0YWM6_9ZZZZ